MFQGIANLLGVGGGDDDARDERIAPRGDRLITALEVSKHSTADDCWIIIHHQVFDVTEYLEDHPGGAGIMLDEAGRDATMEFEEMDHSASARSILKSFYIGELATEEEILAKQQQQSQEKGEEEQKPQPSEKKETKKDAAAQPASSVVKAPPPAAAAAAAVTAAPARIRKKVPLGPGCSEMHWVTLMGKKRPAMPRRISLEELAQHKSKESAWTAIRGRVYDITEYLRFHPGGVPELMRGAGRDGTQLFDEVHRWVNFEFLLQKCYLGVLDA